MQAAFLRSIILLALASAATAQTEPFFATGVDSTDWAQAQSNADGHVLIESPQYPRGLWLHLVDEAGDALTGIRVEYQGRPDSLVAIHCVDPVGGVQEMLVWTRAEGDPLRLILKPKEATDLPTGLAAIDWRIDASAESLLEPVEETRLAGWEGVAAFLRERWQGQTGRVAVQLDANTLVIEVDYPKYIEMLVVHLQQVQQLVPTSLGEVSPLKMQVFTGSLGLREGVILFNVPLFEDSNLESMVRQILDQPQGHLTLETLYYIDHLIGSGWSIYSLAGLEYLTSLWQLYLGNEHIEDLTPLAGLTNLQILGLPYNQIEDLTPLAGLTNLQRLDLDGNQITDVRPLASLKLLTSLYLSSNQITDVSPLVANTGLDKGDYIDLTDNPLSTQALNEHIPALKARGVTVSY